MRRGKLWGFIFVFLFISVFSFGAIIYLKNGITVVGDIIMENDTEIIVRTEKYGEGRIKKRAISYIEHTEPEEINYGESTVGKYTNVENLNIKALDTNTISSSPIATNKSQATSTNIDAGFPMLFGFFTGFSFLWEGFSYVILIFNNNTRYIMNPGIFIDLTYVRLEFSYGFCLSPEVITKESATGFTFKSTNTFSYLRFAFLPKIPFRLSPKAIAWSAFGLEYDYMVVYKGYEYAGVFVDFPYSSDEDMLKLEWFDKNDVWLKAMAGLDIEVADSFYLNFSFGWAYNLTPSPFKDGSAGIEYFFYGTRVDFYIGCSFKL